MTIHRKPKTGNFSIVDNGFTKDPRLDWDAKGMLTYLLSKPDNWTPNKTDLIKAVDSSGEVKVESILKKLEVAGYLIRWQSRDAKGKIFYGAEILECFKDHEEVLNALLERKATDKYFKISVGRFYQYGKNEKPNSFASQKPLSVKKKQLQVSFDSKSAVAVFSSAGEPVGGKPTCILNTDLVKTDLVKTELIKDPLYPPEGEWIEDDSFENLPNLESEDLSPKNPPLLTELLKTPEKVPGALSKVEPTLTDKAFSLPEIIKTSSDVPSALAKARKQKSEIAELAWFQEAYNCNKPDNWASCNTLNDARAKALKKMIKELGLNTAKELWQMAFAHAKTNTFFSDPSNNSFCFDSIFYKNRVVQWAEAWQASIAARTSAPTKNPSAAKFKPFLECFNQDKPVRWPSVEMGEVTPSCVEMLERFSHSCEDSLERFQKALHYVRRDEHWGMKVSMTFDEFLKCGRIASFYKKQINDEALNIGHMTAPSKIEMRAAQEQHAGKIRAQEATYRQLTRMLDEGSITFQEYAQTLEKAGIPLPSVAAAC